MERLFRCPDCSTVSTATQWNDRTEQEYDTNITPITDDKERNMCSFYCPECVCDIPGNEILESNLTGKFPLWTVTCITPDGTHTHAEFESKIEVLEHIESLGASSYDLSYVCVFPPNSSMSLMELDEYVE